ncbi:MAG TPA: hypothetical protein VJ804_08585 [Acidimicrobiales bacterium]|nr:hypothetical protein [Acidimicrobiales bacterium]
MLRRTLALLLPLAVVLGACSGDGGSDLSPEAQAYADAFARDLADEDDGFGVSAGEGDCIGEAIMEELGVEVFQQAGVDPEDLGGAESPGQLLGEGTVTEEQAAAITAAWKDCVDLVHEFALRSGDQFDLDADGLECYEDALEESNILDEYLEVSFRAADPGAGQSVLRRIVGLVQECTVSEDGKGGVVVESIAGLLTANGTVELAQARCLAQALVDDLGAGRLLEVTGNGDPTSVPPEMQEEYVTAVDAAAAACGVPPELVR